jgi:hypothetical protein
MFKVRTRIDMAWKSRQEVIEIVRRGKDNQGIGFFHHNIHHAPVSVVVVAVSARLQN